VTSSPLLVNVYLLGEFGIVITAVAAIAAVLVSRLVPRDSEDRKSGAHAPVPIAQAGPPCRKPILSDTGVDRCLAVRAGTGFLVMNGKAFGATNPHTLRRLKPAHRNCCCDARRPRRYRWRCRSAPRGRSLGFPVEVGERAPACTRAGVLAAPRACLAVRPS